MESQEGQECTMNSPINPEIELWLHYTSKTFVAMPWQFWTFQNYWALNDQSVGMMELTSRTIKMTTTYIQEYAKNLPDLFFS